MSNVLWAFSRFFAVFMLCIIMRRKSCTQLCHCLMLINVLWTFRSAFIHAMRRVGHRSLHSNLHYAMLINVLARLLVVFCIIHAMRFLMGPPALSSAHRYA
jgi:uncharacterized protein YybS (DUF2232 family)